MNSDYLDTVVDIIADDLRRGAALVAATFSEDQHPRDEKGRWTSGDIVYHGSTKDFDQFDAAKVGSTTDEGWLGKGVYFSTDKRVAHYYPLAYETKIDLKDPLHLKLSDFKTDKRHVVREALGLKKDASVDEVTRELIKRGHDGVVLDMSPSGYKATEVMAIHNHTMSVSKKYETGNEKMWDEKAFGRPDKYRKLENFSGAIEVRAAEFMEEDVALALYTVGKSYVEIEAALRVAGFDPSQARDEDGKWTGGGLFHGTPGKNLQSILKNGIKRHYIGKEDKPFSRVFMTPSVDVAKRYALEGSGHGKEGVVLEIRIPKNDSKKLEYESDFLKFKGDIKPEWIKVVAQFGKGKGWRGASGEDDVIYAYVDLSTEQRSLDEYKFQSTQINIPEPLRSKILSFPIDGERETNPHITVKYGLKSGVTAADVVAVCQEVGAIRVVLGQVDIFPASNDIVSLKVVTKRAAEGRWATAAHAFEYTDRYPTPPPDPKIVCTGQCEGMGWIPVYLGVGDTDRSVYGPDETDPDLIAAWYAADAASKTDDGWHFVKCPACGGSGVRGLIRRTLRGCQFKNEAQLRALIAPRAGDVVKINIDSPDLHNLNTLISNLPHTDTYPTYQPHITLAYVPAGQGAYYKGISTFVGEEFTVSEIVFCDTNGGETTISLTPRTARNVSDEARDDHGKWTSGGSSSRVERALATYKPSTRAKQLKAAASEKTIAATLGGQDLPDNEPMDVIVKIAGRTHGVEVKTLIDNSNDKLTMHPESRVRKEQWCRKNKATGHTVVVDKRGPTVTYYHREGFGAFRLAGMERVSLKDLKAKLDR